MNRLLQWPIWSHCQDMAQPRNVITDEANSLIWVGIGELSFKSSLFRVSWMRASDLNLNNLSSQGWHASQTLFCASTIRPPLRQSVLTVAPRVEATGFD